jgi:drug/metabolite transporter (DMT)-like permease
MHRPQSQPTPTSNAQLALPAPLLLLVAVLAISFSAILISWSTAPASIIGMYRLWITVIVFLPFFLRQRHALRLISRRDLLGLCLSGIFLGFHFLFWIESLKDTTVASSMIIAALEPVFVVIGAAFLFKERLSRLGLVSVVLAIVGTVFVGLGDRHQGMSGFHGDILSLLGTVFVSGYLLAGQGVRKKVPSLLYNTIVFFIGGLVLAINSLIHGYSFTSYSWTNWWLFLLLALLPTVLGHGLFNALLTHLPASVLSMSGLGEPIVAIVFAYFLLGQPIGMAQVLGGVLCMGGVALFLWVKQPARAEASA